jgi:hypothetical protein
MRPKPPLLDLNLAGYSCMLSNRTHRLVWFSATGSLQSLLTLTSGSLTEAAAPAGLAPASQAPSQAPLFPTPAVSAPSESGSESGQVCYSAKI